MGSEGVDHLVARDVRGLAGLLDVHSPLDHVEEELDEVLVLGVPSLDGERKVGAPVLQGQPGGQDFYVCPACARANPPARETLPAFAADRVGILRADLGRIFADSRLADAQLGVKILSIDRSEVLYEKNASKLYMPASNNKILTTAVALIRLGPDYCFKTRILADGQISEGILKGNLIIEGSGDPSSSSRIRPKDPFRAFRDWAARLKQRGIYAISGNLLGDGAAFEETPYGRGWAWDDLPEGYAAPVSALQFNENLISLDITPGLNPGSAASVQTTPLANYLTVGNKVITDGSQKPGLIEIQHSRLEDSAAVVGTIPSGSAPVSRTIAVQQCSYATLIQARGWLPPEIANGPARPIRIGYSLFQPAIWSGL